MSWNFQLPVLPEVIGYCPTCNKSIREGEPTKLVLGQLFHANHVPVEAEQ